MLLCREKHIQVSPAVLLKHLAERPLGADLWHYGGPMDSLTEAMGTGISLEDMKTYP